MSDAFSDCASGDIDRIRAKRKVKELTPEATSKQQFVAYRYHDNSVGVYILLKEKLPYQQMLVKIPDGGGELEMDNWGDYKICGTIEEARAIQVAAAKSRKIILREKGKLDKLFDKNTEQTK
jgi:hypothetical protein